MATRSKNTKAATNIKAPHYDATKVMPTLKDVTEILTAKLSYENAQNTKSADDFTAWCERKDIKWSITPLGISWSVSKGKYVKFKDRGWNASPNADMALKYFIISVAIGWDALTAALKSTLKYWGYTSEDIQQYAKDVWTTSENSEIIANLIAQAQQGDSIKLIEAVEKHQELNSKLFTKDEVLKDKVRDKMLEVVDEFLTDLKEQDIKIKVDDILLIGSNASYNYTKDSDIDLHILANAKSADYSEEIAAALYGAYRTIFNKNLDISIYNIPLEIFVETEASERVSNGVYSVKKNKWAKKPVAEEIPDYDKEALDELVNKWESKCKKLISDIEADKLDDEKKVVKILEDIYEKLRKKGISKGEYSIENLAFKELRNKGYLDKFKDFRNELVSKRLSLEETLDRRAQLDRFNQLTAAANGHQPLFQNNEVFYTYNLKDAEVSNVLNKIRKLPFVVEAQANENGKYDFSNTLELAMHKMPKKFYNIRGRIKY
jgi:predicted nucleotidyltransferase